MRKCGYPKPRSGKTSTASKFPIIEYFWGILLSHFPPGPACFCWCCHFWTVFGNNFHEISPKNGACHISVFDLSPCAGSWLGRTAHCIFVFLFIVFMYFCIYLCFYLLSFAGSWLGRTAHCNHTPTQSRLTTVTANPLRSGMLHKIWLYLTGLDLIGLADDESTNLDFCSGTTSLRKWTVSVKRWASPPDQQLSQFMLTLSLSLSLPNLCLCLCFTTRYVCIVLKSFRKQPPVLRRLSLCARASQWPSAQRWVEFESYFKEKNRLDLSQSKWTDFERNYPGFMGGIIMGEFKIMADIIIHISWEENRKVSVHFRFHRRNYQGRNWNYGRYYHPYFMGGQLKIICIFQVSWEELSWEN